MYQCLEMYLDGRVHLFFFFFSLLLSFNHWGFERLFKSLYSLKILKHNKSSVSMATGTAGIHGPGMLASCIHHKVSKTEQFSSRFPESTAQREGSPGQMAAPGLEQRAWGCCSLQGPGALAPVYPCLLLISVTVTDGLGAGGWQGSLGHHLGAPIASCRQL